MKSGAIICVATNNISDGDDPTKNWMVGPLLVDFGGIRGYGRGLGPCFDGGYDFGESE